MYTQNTQINIHHWHKGFWLMAIANMLLSMSSYMLIPVLPGWLMGIEKFTPVQVGMLFASFGLGLYMLGGFCTWLVQRYRRNWVCMISVSAVALSIFFLYYINLKQGSLQGVSLMLVQALIFGAAYGLAQMVLASTLIIDKCDSFLRTEANYADAWFSRFALSLGPLVGILVLRLTDYNMAINCACGCAILSLVLIKLVHFPFRSPEETAHVFSSDRFFLLKGFPIYINLLLYSMSVGMLFSMSHSHLFYAMLMTGFLLALLGIRFVFINADMRSEVITGSVLLIAAFLMMALRRDVTVNYLAPMFVGCGIGIIGSRFLLFFIKLSRHCQRGTSQSTFMLAWETGLALGLGIGFSAFYPHNYRLLIVALVITVVALLMYHFYTHNWYMKHKNR